MAVVMLLSLDLTVSIRPSGSALDTDISPRDDLPSSLVSFLPIKGGTTGSCGFQKLIHLEN
jgi:hypothetical protein